MATIPLFTDINPSCSDLNAMVNILNANFGVVTAGTNASYTGNGSFGGTLGVTGVSTLTGATNITGLLTANGGIAGGSSANIAINTNKFTVTASNGNTLVAGTLTSTGLITATAAVTVGTTLGVTGLTTLTGGLTQAPVAGGSTKTLTAANAGTTTLLDTAAGTVVTLPAATGTGNVYKFFCTLTNSSNANKILAVGSDYLIGNINGGATTSLTAFHALVAATYQSLQMPFTGSQPSGGIAGDWFEFTDVAAAKWAVKGQFTSGTTATTPFSTATS
jgi:hypothetical protein